MEIGLTVAIAWKRHRKPHHFVAVESPDYLASDFTGDYEDPLGNEISVAVSPHGELHFDAALEVRQLRHWRNADLRRIGRVVRPRSHCLPGFAHNFNPSIATDCTEASACPSVGASQSRFA